jgi:acetyl-CoA/propionyl-CoA carboxylase, biotin carboxylase, biotin carboxyl carrier protein
VLEHPVFREAGATTTFITDFPDVIPPPVGAPKVIQRPERTQERILVEVNGQRFDVVVHGENASAGSLATADQRRRPQRSASHANHGSRSSGNDLVSPIQGTAIRVEVAKGERVEAGQLVCVVEAMKMENELSAHHSGTVGSLAVEVGSAVKVGDVIATIEPA